MNVLETYYRENFDRLVGYARNRVDNRCLYAAEDAVQEAFSRAVKYFLTYKEAEPFDAWFKRILRNAIINIKNGERDKGVVYIEEMESNIPIKHKNVILSKEVLDEFKHINDRDRDILEAYFFYGLKTREIADIMPVTHSNVRYIISKFRERARV